MQASSDHDASRVKAVIELIDSQGWSFNSFLIAFYSSSDAFIAKRRGHCLTKSDGARYVPEELLGYWLNNSPAKSRSSLKKVIIDCASKLAIKEADRACVMDSLSVSTTSVTHKDLDEEFLLSRLEGIYTESLPLLWSFLRSIVMSANRSEKKKGEPAACKETRAEHAELPLCLGLTSSLTHSKQACVVIISILLFSKNRGTSAFQIIMGIFIGTSGASKRVLNVLNHMGISLSYEWVSRVQFVTSCS